MENEYKTEPTFLRSFDTFEAVLSDGPAPFHVAAWADRTSSLA